jgi:hypothetical protein
LYLPLFIAVLIGKRLYIDVCTKEELKESLHFEMLYTVNSLINKDYYGFSWYHTFKSKTFSIRLLSLSFYLLNKFCFVTVRFKINLVSLYFGITHKLCPYVLTYNILFVWKKKICVFLSLLCKYNTKKCDVRRARLWSDNLTLNVPYKHVTFVVSVYNS